MDKTYMPRIGDYVELTKRLGGDGEAGDQGMVTSALLSVFNNGLGYDIRVLLPLKNHNSECSAYYTYSEHVKFICRFPQLRMHKPSPI